MPNSDRKYVKKNHGSVEKKVISARIDSAVAKAFQNASVDAKSEGYSMSMSDVIEIALRDAIDEFSNISGVEYLKGER